MSQGSAPLSSAGPEAAPGPACLGCVRDTQAPLPRVGRGRVGAAPLPAPRFVSCPADLGGEGGGAALGPVSRGTGEGACQGQRRPGCLSRPVSCPSWGAQATSVDTGCRGSPAGGPRGAVSPRLPVRGSQPRPGSAPAPTCTGGTHLSVPIRSGARQMVWWERDGTGGGVPPRWPPAGAAQLWAAPRGPCPLGASLPPSLSAWEAVPSLVAPP